MNCPECQRPIDSATSACPNCGLLLMMVRTPLRRRDDHSGQKRRASDSGTSACRFCDGRIRTDAVRCLHCGEILNDDYRRARSARIRLHVNHASWVAYLFGLLMLLFLPAVGAISIAAGLLLSIAYYAIPIELEPGRPRESRFQRATRAARARLAPERISIRMPHLPRIRLVFVGTPILAMLAGFLVNFFFLQLPMNQVLRESRAYEGMKISTHFQYWVVPSVLIYDLQRVTGGQSRLDVHTVLLEFAKKMRSHNFRKVELMYRGRERFALDGATFRRVGDEYSRRNLEFVLIDFPEAVQPIREGAPPRGGDALLDFHNRWYANEALADEIKASDGEGEGPPDAAPEPVAAGR